MASKATVVGLDIGSHTIKAVWAVARGQDIQIKRAESMRLPTDGSDKRTVIRPWVEQMGLARFPCVLSLPGQQTMFQPFLLPPGDPRTLDQAAAMEVIRFNDMASETMVHGHTPIDITPSEKRFLLAMSRQTVLDNLLQLATEMRLNVVDVVPSPVALFNALTSAELPDERINMFVNVGHTTTDIALGSKKGLLFARSFSSGGAAFTAAIAKARGLTAMQAENMKLSQSQLNLAIGIVAGELKTAVDLWISEIQSSISVYKNLYAGPVLQPARIVLTGGGALLVSFADYVRDALGMELRLAGPIAGAPATVQPATYLPACGLVRTALGNATAPISLLPTTLRDEQSFRRQKPFWIAAAATAALILGVSLAGGFRDISRKGRQLNEQAASLSRRKALVAEIERTEARNVEILRMAGPVRDMLQWGTVMRNILTIVSEAREESDWITMICDAESYFGDETDKSTALARARGLRRGGREQEPAGGDPNSRRLERVLIEGYTLKPDLSTVQSLIARLEQSERVASADLLSDDKLIASGSYDIPRKAIRYVIDVKMATP